MASRAQCLVIRGNKILMAKHCENEQEYWCLPGGGIEPDELPSEAALRELQEECNRDWVSCRLLVTGTGR